MEPLAQSLPINQQPARGIEQLSRNRTLPGFPWEVTQDGIPMAVARMERTLVAQDWVENKNIKNQRTVEPEMRKSQGADRDTADSTHIAHTLAAVIQKSEGTSDASLAKLDWTSRN